MARGAQLALLGSLVASGSAQARIDLRAYQSPVKNQGHRGTCTAFAVAAALEGFPGVPLDASEQFLYALAKDQQTTHARVFAGYYQNRKWLRALFTDGVSLREYQDSLRLYGTCEERFFPYESKRLVISPDLVKLLPKADRNRLAQMVYNRTQFTSTAREAMKLLGKFTATEVEVIDFSSIRRDARLGDQARSKRIEQQSRALIDWLRTGLPGRQAIPTTYQISKRAWGRYLNKPEAPVLTIADLPIAKADSGGHAVAIVGWTPSVAGYVKQPKVSTLLDTQGYYIFKNSWGTAWGGLGGYGLIRADLHRLTILQSLKLTALQRRQSSSVHSPFDKQNLIEGAWRLKAQVIRRGDREALLLSTYASDLRDPNLPAMRYVVSLNHGGTARREISPLITQSATPGFPWQVELPAGADPRIEVTLVHHRQPGTTMLPSGGRRFVGWIFTATSRTIDLASPADGKLTADQAKAALAGR